MSNMVKCPKCGEYVPEDNLRCYFCGELLDISVGPLSFISNSNKRVIAIFIAVLLIIMFFIWLF